MYDRHQRSSEHRSWDEAQEKDRETLVQGMPPVGPVAALEKIGDVLQRAVTSGFARPSLEAARSLLATMEKECSSGGAVPATALETAAIHSVRLAGATLDGSWLDAVIRIHHARGAVLPVEVVDALYILLRRVRVDFVTFSRYLHAMNECRSELTPTERFALHRTEGLVGLLRR